MSNKTNLLNIFHYGDMQYELRISGEGSQRHNEFHTVLAKTEKAIEESKPDIIVIGGDIYQYADTNGEEQEMFTRHLHNILPHTKRIIIIPGNHDIKQKYNTIIKHGEKTNIGDSIRSIVLAINNPKISYYEHSGIYKDTEFDLSWAVWSQIDKHSSLEPKPDYSPWVNNEVPESPFIELFHDPIRGAKDFNGEENIKFQKYGISLSDFKANLIIANDIHTPDMIWFGGEESKRLFTYSSSLVMRNFGEGDYYNDEIKKVDGNKKHGYNKILFDLNTNLPVSCEFFPVHNPYSRHTFYLSKAFQYTKENIHLLTLAIDVPTSDNIGVRIIASGNLSAYVEAQAIFEKEIRGAYPNANLSLESTNDIVLDQVIDTEGIEDLESALDRNKIIDLSKNYISKLVDSTSTIDKEDKLEAKKYITDLFIEEFNKQSFDQILNNIDLVKFNINNFMNFAETEIVFKNNQINRIIGTNGIGKTKIWSFLAWLFVDSITANQNSREKTYNYSLLFNDSSEIDEVIGNGEFFVNGELHIINKKLTRSWKSGKKDIKHPEWWTLLKGAPVVEQTLTIQKSTGNVVELKNEEVTEYLKNLIGSFTDFENATFMDGIKLRSMIKQDSSFIIQAILDAMGLTIIDNLLASYNSIKEEKLGQLKKPEHNTSEYQQLIDFENTFIEEVEKDIKKIGESLEKAEFDIVETNKNIDTKNLSKHSVKKSTDLEIEITDLSKINSEKTIRNEEINLTLEEAKTTLSIDYDQLLKLKNDEMNVESTKINSKNQTISNNNTEIEKIKGYQKELLTAESTNWHENIAKEVRTKITSNTEKINKLQPAKDGIIQTFVDEINSKYDSQKLIFEEKLKALQDSDKILQTQNFDLQTLNNTLKSRELAKEREQLQLNKLLETEGKCGTCKQKLSGDNFLEYQTEIERIKGEIAIIDDEILVTNESIISKNNATEILIDKMKIQESEKETEHAYLAKIELLKLGLQSNKQLIENDIVSIAEKQKSISTFDEAINKLKEENTELEDSISNTKLQEYLMNYIKTDSTYLGKNKEIEAYNFENQNLGLDVKQHEEKHLNLKKEHDDLWQKRQDQTKLKDSISLLKEEISSNNATITVNQSRIDIIQNTEMNLAKLNEKIDEEIIELRQNLVTIQDEKLRLMTENGQKSNSIAKSTEKIEKHEQGIIEYKKWRIAEASLKLYKKLLSKDGLPQHIFSAIVPIVNKMLNDNLSSVDFRLIFHPEYLDLRFIDIKRDTMRPIQFISGMQETIVGLSITALLLVLNQSRKFNFIFIDEVSGKVTDGSQLTYESKNYKKILANFIQSLSEKINIYIIDPVLTYKDERVLEVQPGENGSIIQEIEYVVK